MRNVSIRKRALQDRLVAGRDRLGKEHGLTGRDFVRALGLKERTLRYWARRQKQREERKRESITTGSGSGPTPFSSRTASARAGRAGRLGRFGLDVTLPGLQAMADTSPWEILGVPLSIVAVQDPGARRERPWESFEVDDHEDHDVVLKAVREAIGEKPGVQLVTDQGTPYVCEAIRQACEEMEVELAPQKEGTPTEKATLERSFRTVKEALAPLARLSAKLATAIPALRNAVLAKSVGRLILSTFLRVHALGRRETANERAAGADPVVLEAVAEEQRERARAESRSVKLKLEGIHAAYDFEVPIRRFVRANRGHWLEDIDEAEDRMGVNACRCHARRCDRYFAAILRRVAEKNAQWRLKARRQRMAEHQSRLDHERAEAEQQRREAEPERAIADALDLVARQYDPQKRRLLFGGVGPGRARLVTALEQLEKSEDGAARDRAEVGWRTWRARNAEEGGIDDRDGRTAAVRSLFDRVVTQVLRPENRSTEELASDILGLRRFPKDQRPPPEEVLRL